MRFTSTEKELELSKKIQSLLSGLTFDEAKQSLDHARGVIMHQREHKADELTFLPKGSDIL